MSKPWLLLDVDDVLYDFVAALHEIGLKTNKLRDPSLHYKDWQTYNHLELLKFENQDDFRKFMVEEKVLNTNKSTQGASEFLKWAKDHYKLGFLTARGYEPKAKKITEEFIRNLGVEPDLVVISGLYGESKTAHLEKFIGSKVVGMVDDSEKHIKDFREIGIPTFLMHQNWNENANKEYNRVFSLSDVKHQLLKTLEKDVVKENNVSIKRKM